MSEVRDAAGEARSAGSKRRVWRGIQLALALVAAVAGYFTVMGLDAPDGLMSTGTVPWTDQALAHLWVLSTVGFFVAGRWGRSLAWSLVCMGLGFGVFVLLYAFFVAERLSASRWEAACGADDAPSCAALAGLYWRGAGVPQDDARASALDAGACAAGHSASCVRLARRAAPSHREAACQQLRTGCKDGERRDCDALAEHCGTLP